MSASYVITPLRAPNIVVPDAGPLISLAQAGLLHLLHEAAAQVVVVDMVAIEVTRDPGKPGASVLADWLRAGNELGSNFPVLVEETETGLLYTAALEARPDFKLRHGGETAIVDWLAEKIAGTDRGVIVLYENGRVPAIVRNQSMDADIDVVTTRAFLDTMQRRQMALDGVPLPPDGSPLASGDEAYWKRVQAVGLTTSPAYQVSMQRRSRP